MVFRKPLLQCVALIPVCLCVYVSDALAAAAVQRRQQMQKAQQGQMMQQAYQQAMAQKQAQEAAAYQQAVAQRQAMTQQAAYQKAAAEYAAYKQAMQQAVAKRNAEAQAVQQARQQIIQRQTQQAAQYQQAAAQKQMTEAAAYQQALAARRAVGQNVQADVNQQVREYSQYLVARKTALARQGVAVQQAAVERQLMQGAAVQRVKAQQARVAAEYKVAAEAAGRMAVGRKLATDIMASRAVEQQKAPVEEADRATVVEIKDLWDALDRSSEPWSEIVDREAKLLTVAEYIDRFGKLKVRISKPPGYYVGIIDAFAEQMPDFLSAPFMNVLSYAAIVEYDFENGTNKDELARKVLGAERFEANRRRVAGQ